LQATGRDQHYVSDDGEPEVQRVLLYIVNIATLTTPDVMLNKVVVAYLDGRRARGCVYDFSPLKDTFRLVSESGQKGPEVALKDLKAVFFVKDFRGDSKYNESKKIEEGGEKLK
jgi:hypothetical protein